MFNGFVVSPQPAHLLRQTPLNEPPWCAPGALGALNLHRTPAVDQFPQVLQYLQTAPSPLQDESAKSYSTEAFAQLLEKLREANFKSELTKGERLSLFNLRPSNSAVLSTAVEDLEERFTEDEQNRMLEIIHEVLGGNLAQQNGGEDYEDEAM